MKIDRLKLKKGTSEFPQECQNLINRLRTYSRLELLDALSQIKTWTFGKCELYYWIDVLDLFDSILEEAADFVPDNKWSLACDTHFSDWEKKLLLWTLHFTTLLMEHSFSRHLYNSMEHLITLLSSSDMSVVLGVLNLLYMFSKRSNFITRLNNEKRQALLSRLHHLAESWGGKENGFGLADCCDSTKPIPASATTLHFEFYNESETKDTKNKQYFSCIHIENVDKINKTPPEIMKGLINLYDVPPEKEMWLFTHVRLAHRFADYKSRLLCVQARLQALSCLVYSNALQNAAHTLLYNGLLEELVELLELQYPYLVEIRSAALRTLTSIIHLDRNPHFPKKPGSRLNMIIDVTGASQYHGFLPVLVRNCITSLTISHKKKRCKKKSTDGAESEEEEGCADKQFCEYPFDINLYKTVSSKDGKFPLPLATALFSFLYHLASYETGGEALVSCGMMEALLNVINWPGNELEHITFVTRAVRVIDLITNIDMQAFQSHGGLVSFINRLDIEVNLCRKEQSFEIKVRTAPNLDEPGTSSQDVAAEDSQDSQASLGESVDYSSAKTGKDCLPQRAALLKSMLNFFKKALQDAAFADSIRHVMEGTLPSSLKHIISNAEYYGSSLFLLATDVVTVYVFQEPSLLSALQDNGLTDVVLHALLIKDVPATREVLGSLPNVFSALCLNARGLASFVKCRPFERLFKVLLSPTYLAAMRRRRSSDPIGDTATNLGNAMDELMRHQPSLKVVATAAIIKLLEELVQLGTDPKYVCWRAHNKSEVSPAAAPRPVVNTEGSSDEEDDDEEEASTSSHTQREDATEQQPTSSEKTPIALVDYILNVMKFVDAILSNNSTDDHCREFVAQGGLVPLLKILGLPNLPVDYPVTAAAQAVASVCKSILNLAHEPKVLKQGLTQLGEVLQTLETLYGHFYTDSLGGSTLLHELANASHLESAFNSATATPLLHAMGAAHGYVLMFVHVCRTGQSDIRQLSLQHWGSEEGLAVLRSLAELYTTLVWESTLLLALCSDDIIPSNCDFGKEDMEKLNIPDKSEATTSTSGNNDSNGMTSAMEALSTNPPPVVMEVDSETSNNKPTSQQLKYIKPLLGASSRLGRALAELFGLLVKLCVGSPIRQRRGQNIVASPPLPSPYARSVAKALNYLLANGLDSKILPPSPIPKFRLTFLICSVGFTSPMLFDEKRYPYHLMLQKFVNLGGQVTFFKTFHWALSADGTIPLEKGLEHPDLPEGTGEFLDAWLTLLEKMVNPKAILDSPHVISSKATKGVYKVFAFDPLKYLIQIHKLAFEAVMLLWGKKPLPTYGNKMSESILSILRHILRGEKIIKERMSKPEEKVATEAGSAPTTGGTAPSTSASLTTRTEADVDSNHLRQLMDMGFSLEHCREALLHTLNVEQATDYLLNNPPPLLRTSNSAMDVEMTEDDQMLRAIAMSLGEQVAGGPAGKRKESKDDGVPLSKELINQFTQGSLQICLDLIDKIPETVYKVCELLVTIMKRNGAGFRNKLLGRLLVEICNNTKYILENVNSREDKNERMQELAETDQAARLGYLTHLYTLLFEGPTFNDMRVPCAVAVRNAVGLPQFIELVTLAESVMANAKQPVESPKWLTPILLLLDQVEKVAVCTQRKQDMHLSTTRVWKWFDLNSGKWTPYSTTNNKLINEAYWNGESNIRVTCGRRRYTITFSNMCQMNDETGNNRPISMTLVDFDSSEKTNEMEVDNKGVTLTQKEKQRNVVVPGIKKEQASKLVTACVKLMKLPIDKDLLHAIMRISLRLTRDYDNAKIFALEGGVKLLLKLKQSSGFTGFATLATLLIRHVLEEPTTLALAMEKVIRARTLTNMPPAYKELLYVTRQMSATVCRNPDIFLQVAKTTLRVDLNVYHRRTEEEEDATRMILRCQPPTRASVVPMEEEYVAVEVIYDLLNALVLPLEVAAPATAEGPEKASASTQTRECTFTTARDLLRNSSSNDILSSDATDDVIPVNPILRVRLTRSNSENVLKSIVEEEAARKPLLPKSSILKLLAEAVRSYVAVAKLITEYTYAAGTNENITEDCSALAFMLDKLLSMTDTTIDRDCSLMTRMLVASLASCNHSPDSQSIVVQEVKYALVRALALPESADKHTQIQLLTGLISTMIENCPPTNNTTSRGFKVSQFPGSFNNNIVKVMLRRGIFADLARVPHCLDLSSPSFPITINSALKPMEALSRIVNQPVTGVVPGKFAKKNQTSNIEENGTPQSGATSTEVTNAQGEEAVEDTENTEHDSIIASSLNLSPNEAQSDARQRDNAIDDIMSQLLMERENTDSNRSGRTHAMDIDDEANIDYDNERDATEELMSTESGDSDSNASDQEVEDEENDADVDPDEMDEEDENDDHSVEDEETNEGNEFFDDENAGVFQFTADDSDDDILMIQYGQHENENETMGPIVRWSGNGIALGMFDETNSAAESGAPSSHPLLSSRHNVETNALSVSRTQRANRQRRFQYLQINSRNRSPPLILHSRLLGQGAQNVPLAAGPVVSTPLRDRRVVVMDSGFGLFQNAEEQIDFVDQSGYLFGPSLAATLNNVPSALYWWNEEGKLLDGESQPDCCVYVCYRLVSTLEKHRATELTERKRRREKEEEAKKRNTFKSIRMKDKKEATEKNASDQEMRRTRSSAEVSETSPVEENRQQNDTDDDSSPPRLTPQVPFIGPPIECTLPPPVLVQQTNASTETVAEESALTAQQVNAEQDAGDADDNSIYDEYIIPTTPPQVFGNERVDRGSPDLFFNAAASMNRRMRDLETNDDDDPLDPRILHSSPNRPTTDEDRMFAVSSMNSRFVDELEERFQNSSRSSSGSSEQQPNSEAPSPPSNPYANACTVHYGTAGPPQPVDHVREREERAYIEQFLLDERRETREDRQRDRQRLLAAAVFDEIVDAATTTTNAPATNSLETTSVESSQTTTSDESKLSTNPENAETTSSQSTQSSETTVVSESTTNTSSSASQESATIHVDMSSENTANTTTAAAAAAAAAATDRNPYHLDSIQVEMTDLIVNTDEVPEGVDPSFFAALPLDMRREVIEQQRLHRLQQRAATETAVATSDAVASTSAEVSPEFLAALPPQLQQEVLAQQRLEQRIQAAARANPNEPVDAGAFFDTLQPSLRTLILSDIEDSQMAALPPNLAAEAQTLRRTWEERNRQISQDRFFQTNLTAILRQTARGRIGSRFNTHIVPPRNQWNSWNRTDPGNNSTSTGNLRVRGRQLLDHESLSCLLVLLFANDPKLNMLRLHRVIRNLCYHEPTRDWIIKALLSIIERSVNIKPEIESSSTSSGKLKRSLRPGPLVSKLTTDPKNAGNGATWLNIKMDAALGCRANVFIVNRATGKRSDRLNASSVTLHPQAAPIVCRHALDLFISLSKSFPAFLLPLKLKDESKEAKEKVAVSPTKNKSESTDFWNMLLKLDCTSSKKGKCVPKAHCSTTTYTEVDCTVSTFDQSAFGQLLSMLSSPLVYRSTQLTDKLLRLLSVITMALPEINQYVPNNKNPKPKRQRLESICAPEGALTLAIKVLTYKSCSEEGLEDVTTMLLNIANCSLDMSYMILKLLLYGAQQIGEVVTEQIQKMLEELQALNKKQKKKDLVNERTSSKGILSDRFTNESVVITASTKVKATCDLQLPSMAPLISKTSNQVFFLRVLRVIVQIREAIKKGIKHVSEQKKQETESKDSEDTEEEATSMDTSSAHKDLEALSDQLHLEKLWDTLSSCLLELEHTPDHHAVLVLQPAVEAFFLVHSPQQGASSSIQPILETQEEEEEEPILDRNSASPTPSAASKNSQVPADQFKFLNFAEKHRTVLNQILRQTTAHLADGPFSVLVDHTRVLDFDVKRRYFRTELERLDQGMRREELAVHVRRSHIFEDSFKELYRRTPEEWKNRFYIVFEDEEGQDAGGLLREWYVIISRDIFNPMYALFTVSPGDRVTYMINSSSHYNPNHLCYYKFVGRVIAKAIYDNKLLECYFTRSFYKHILGIPVKYTDMESEDYSFYNGLVYLMENNVETLGYDITFSTEVQEFGVTETRDLIPNGRNIVVTEETKMEYIRLSCQMKMTGAIRTQLNAFLEGFYEIIPLRLISIFNEQELELFISGLPNVDIEELRANTEYHKYQANSLQIQWFWRALRSFDQADRAKFLQFVTGTSKVPLQGFGALEGMNGVQKFQIHRDDRSTDRLPSAHTCFNQLDLPVYETYDKLRAYLLKAIHECSEGFGFA